MTHPVSLLPFKVELSACFDLSGDHTAEKRDRIKLEITERKGGFARVLPVTWCD